jgi:CO/xanthine dehydrogenase Mo-binding subunit
MAKPEAATLPLGRSRRLGAWFDLAVPGRVTLKTGKVELGQGILTALRQIAAEELDLPLSAISVVSGDTAISPFEGGTVGSMSIQDSGPMVRAAAAELRQRLVQAAALRSNLPAGELAIVAGQFRHRDIDLGDSLWTVAAEIDLDAEITGAAPMKRPGEYRIVGTSPAQIGLADRIGGAAYIHDIDLPGMLHGRMLRPPHPQARLGAVDVGRVAAMPGVVHVLQEGDLIGVVAADEHALSLAMERLGRACDWQLPQPNDRSRSVQEILEQHASRDSVIRDDAGATEGAGGGRLEATYTKPLIGHGSIGPSCGIALVEADDLSVWSHSQTVFALRDQVARVTGLAPDRVRVRHAQAAGCYGHNGADDAAMDAVLLAQAVPGRPVRVQWTRRDELVSEPLGSPMRVRLAATVDSGRIMGWELETRSGTHIRRPGWNGEVNLLAPAAAAGAWTFDGQKDLPVHNGGTKNAVALYDMPQRVTHQFVPDLPFRLSTLRSLGAFANVFAIESFMDELADTAGIDPVAFRLAHLSDPRARAVIERAAAIGDWSEPCPDGWGRGLGFARFRNAGSYCAVVALVSVEEQVELQRLWAVVDAGLAINPAGVAAQIEGGMLQAASWALKEAVPTEGTLLTAETWRDYPILGFAEVPETSVEVISNPEEEPTGVGEASLGPTAGAIGNAVARALGIRIRDLPLTRDRVVDAIMNS